MPETILGLNAYHGDASAAIFVDGECVAAAEEERFSRIKHQAGFPALAAQWCLETTGLAPADLDHVAVGRNPGAHLHRKIAYALGRSPATKMLKSRLANAAKVSDSKTELAAALGTTTDGLRAKFHRVEHHRAHLASAYLCGPFDDAAMLSIDGMGDFCSTMWGTGSGAAMDIDGFVTYPHSLGYFYTAFTQFLGLPSYGDEYKLMGLGAYGTPRFLEALRPILQDAEGLKYKLNLDFFRHHTEGIEMTWESGTPEIGQMWGPEFEKTFGPARQFRAEVTDRDKDLAASVQARLEEVVLDMLRNLAAQTKRTRLVMAGGVALNCVVNGKVRAETPFEEIWVQPAANDSGISIGAGLYVWNHVLGRKRTWQMQGAYLGPEYSDVDYKRALSAANLEARTYPDEELFDFVAGRIAEGAIVGWFQERMEFGPRALGNRSIICDARRHDMKDILNARIKFREPFRPFAPSILAEKTGQWFTQDYPSPYMLLAYEVRPDKRDLIPAVTHEDGTGRLQTVERSVNPRYYSLIDAFDRRTGVPVVLNTSFNENEPICCRPEEAVDCFARTQMDVLVLGNLVVDRGGKR